WYVPPYSQRVECRRVAPLITLRPSPANLIPKPEKSQGPNPNSPGNDQIPGPKIGNLVAGISLGFGPWDLVVPSVASLARGPGYPAPRPSSSWCPVRPCSGNRTMLVRLITVTLIAIAGLRLAAAEPGQGSLPAGALVRLADDRLRHAETVTALCFLPDGRL